MDERQTPRYDGDWKSVLPIQTTWRIPVRIRPTFQMFRNTALTIIIAAAVLGATPSACARPEYVYLTYPGDPSTSIVIGYQTRDLSETSKVYYDTQSRDGEVEAYAHEASGVQTRIPGLPATRTIHHVTLTGLEPGTTYYFVAGDEDGGFTGERSFRTIANDDAPLRFVTGGDMGATRQTRRLLHVAAEQDPDFAVVGGDIAYANGDLKEYRDWDHWFKNWDELMRTSDGRMIPIVAAIGNHEVNDSDSADWTVRAPFYSTYFGTQPGGTYFDLAFGTNMALLVLDTGHIAPHDGDQAAWLDLALAAHAEVPFVFAVYHVPFYPSHRDYDASGSVAGRTHWAPLFDAYRLTAAFENHDHTMKRSKPIHGNQVDEEGVLYLGDGSWGVVPRDVDEKRRWYEAVALGVGHVWVVDVSSELTRYRALDNDGEVLDETTSAPRLATVR